MTKIEATDIIDAPVEKVWDFVVNPDNFSKYILGYIEGRFLSENKMGIDSEFEWFTKFLGFHLKSVEKVIEWKEYKKIAYHGTLAGAEFWSQMLFDRQNSSTKFTIIIEYKMPYSVLGNILDIFYFEQRVKREVKYSINEVKKHFQ